MSTRKKKTCGFEGCTSYDNGGGLCSAHWLQRKQGKTLRPVLRTPLERFWAKVDRKTPEECWPWLGATNGGSPGHGKIHWGGRYTYAHRVSYELEYGVELGNLKIDHQCRNPICVNPGHLKAVTQAENLQNVGLRKDNTSGYRGVSYFSDREKWVADVAFTENGVQTRKRVGYYETAEEAAEAAKAYRMIHHTNNLEDRKND